MPRKGPLEKELPPALSFLIFFPAILANTYLARVAAGIKTSLASAIVATMLWIDPKRDLHLDSLAVLAIITFLVVGALNVVIIHLLREERECSQRLPHARGGGTRFEDRFGRGASRHLGI
jgi:K+-sensing histidine kinase KdpD